MASSAGSGAPVAPRILIVKLGAIGDVVYTLPLLHRLRLAFPGAHLAWVVEPRARAIIDGHPELDELIPFERARGARGVLDLRRRLRVRPFDVALDLQRLFKSAIIARMSGAPRRLSFDGRRAKELSHLFASERLPPRPGTRHMALQYLEFADALGAADCDISFVLPPSMDGPPLVGPTDVVVGIGAGKPANRWPDEHWAALVDGLAGAGLSVALAGGPSEKGAAVRIAATARAPFRDLVGHTTLPDLARCVRAARLYVGLDSGTTHLACALGQRVLALYGAADERRTGPWGPRARVVRTRPSCAPCGRRHCPLETTACMTDLTVAPVLAAVQEALRLP